MVLFFGGGGRGGALLEEKVSDVKFEEFIELIADEATVSSADVKAVFDRSPS